MTKAGTVEVKVIDERQVDWVPKGHEKSSHKIATIRDGKLYSFPQIDGYFVEADPDGCMEFIQAIKGAIAETAKGG